MHYLIEDERILSLKLNQPFQQNTKVAELHEKYFVFKTPTKFLNKICGYYTIQNSLIVMKLIKLLHSKEIVTSKSLPKTLYSNFKFQREIQSLQFLISSLYPKNHVILFHHVIKMGNRTNIALYCIFTGLRHAPCLTMWSEWKTTYILTHHHENRKKNSSLKIFTTT